MSRERIGIEARLCQCGHHRQSAGLLFFEKMLFVLRFGLAAAWVSAWRFAGASLPWILLAAASIVFFCASLILSACERLLKNRWMKTLRSKTPAALSDLLCAFTFRDVVLAVRIGWYYRWRSAVRSLLFWTVPLVFALWIVFRVSQPGLSRAAFAVLLSGFALFFLVSLGCFLSAREALRVSTSLLTDPESFAQRKNSLIRLDKDCFSLLKLSLSFLFLPENVRFQAKALYALIGQ